jgi:hypothetical protein
MRAPIYIDKAAGFAIIGIEKRRNPRLTKARVEGFVITG